MSSKQAIEDLNTRLLSCTLYPYAGDTGGYRTLCLLRDSVKSLSEAVLELLEQKTPEVSQETLQDAIRLFQSNSKSSHENVMRLMDSVDKIAKTIDKVADAVLDLQGRVAKLEKGSSADQLRKISQTVSESVSPEETKTAKVFYEEVMRPRMLRTAELGTRTAFITQPKTWTSKDGNTTIDFVSSGVSMTLLKYLRFEGFTAELSEDKDSSEWMYCISW